MVHYKYHFITANYEIFDFKELFNIGENRNYKWYNPQHLMYQKGDIVYILF